MTRAITVSLLVVLTLPPLASSPAAQPPATQPHWSTFFGGTGHDLGARVRIGPGGLVTVAGTALSQGLATPGAFQATPAGNGDAFVARFDPRLPPGQQLLWCTYLGGSGMEITFDLHVDAQGVTTIAGLTDSADFPMSMPNQPPRGFQRTRNGGSDGFIVQIDATGGRLLYSTYLGGSGHDRVGGLVFDRGGVLAVVGVTESADLPGTAGTIFPTYRGGTSDAFVARVDLTAPATQQLLWATHLGGPGADGPTYATIAANGGLGVIWEGILQRHSIVAHADDSISTATPSVLGDPQNTTPGCFQPTNNGSDTYLATLDPGGTRLVYGTYFGGAGEDLPHAIALHSDGGVVICGHSRSTNTPVTPGAYQTTNRMGAFGAIDGFVCWLDGSRGTGPSQLRYATYFGGDGGQDLFHSLAIESSGIVTLVGSGYGGGALPFPTTRGSLRPGASANDRCGAIVRLRLQGNGTDDLLYSTLIGGYWTVLHGVALDEVGDAFVVGTTEDAAYPTQNPHQATLQGLRDLVLTHLPLLPGGTDRRDLGLATPACTARLYSSTLRAPAAGNLAFALGVTNAPPSSVGVVVLGSGPPAGGPQILFNVWLLADPILVGPIVAIDPLGFGEFVLPIPLTVPAGQVIHTQWVCVTNPSCPGSGLLAASERLVFATL